MTVTQIHTRGDIEWTAVRSKTGDQWILTCDQLGLVLEASSLEEFGGLIEEATRALFESLVEDCELDAFLREKNWKAVSHDDGSQELDFDVPWTLHRRLTDASYTD